MKVFLSLMAIFAIWAISATNVQAQQNPAPLRQGQTVTTPAIEQAQALAAATNLLRFVLQGAGGQSSSIRFDHTT